MVRDYDRVDTGPRFFIDDLTLGVGLDIACQKQAMLARPDHDDAG